MLRTTHYYAQRLFLAVLGGICDARNQTGCMLHARP